MSQTFAELFADARRQSGLNQTQFALFIGIDSADVRRYESGTRVPYNDRLFQICGRAGIDPRVAAEARALSREQQAAKGKSNAVHRAALAVYAKSCKKRKQPVSELISGLRLLGGCYCSGGTFSSRAALLKVCRDREKKGDRRCQSCEVLRSGGMDIKALKMCNITFLEVGL
jgi:transcriptional regulator with XRE-family HTH domain